MGKLAAVLSLALLGCGTEFPETVSSCGMGITDEEAPPSLEAVNALEQIAIRFGLFKCEDLAEIIVFARKDVSWISSYGNGVSGETQCTGVHTLAPFNRVIIGNARDYPLSNTALTHELIHAALECPWSNNAHDGWEKYRALIASVNAQLANEGY